MSNAIKYIFSPEIIWLCVCIGMKYFGKYNIAVQGKYNDILESMSFLLPIVLIGLCISLYWIPTAPKNYLLLRIFLISIFGGHFVFTYCAESHTMGGPGAGMIYIVGMGFTIFAVAIGAIVKYIFYRV